MTDPAAIDDEQVAFAEEGDEVQKRCVDGGAAGAGKHHEPRRVALGEGPLGDRGRRQFEVEVGGLQKRLDWPGSRSVGVRPKCS